MTLRGWILWGCRVVLAGVFIAACLPKIIEPHEFAVSVFRYQMVPYPLVNIMAIYLPWLELVTGITILVPRWSRASAMIILGLLLVFTTAISINLVRGIDIACGCFSVSEEVGRIGGLSLLRNVVLVAMTGVVIFFSKKINKA